VKVQNGIQVARKCPGTLKVMFFCHVGLVMDQLVPPQTLVSGVYCAMLNCYLIMLSGVSDPLKGHKFESFDTSNNATWVSLWHFNRSDFSTEGNQQTYQREVQRTCIKDMWLCFLLYSAY